VKAQEVVGGMQGVAESGDVVPAVPAPFESQESIENQATASWAKSKRVAELADAADAKVQGLVADLRALRDAAKAAPAGAFALSRAQVLTLVKGLLYVMKGEKSE